MSALPSAQPRIRRDVLPPRHLSRTRKSLANVNSKHRRCFDFPIRLFEGIAQPVWERHRLKGARKTESGKGGRRSGAASPEEGQKTSRSSLQTSRMAGRRTYRLCEGQGVSLKMHEGGEWEVHRSSRRIIVPSAFWEDDLREHLQSIDAGRRRRHPQHIG
jgi:hypothetical protein